MRVEEAIERGLVCPECSGHGAPWPDNPSMCGGMPCPVCNGVCQRCEGNWTPSSSNPDPTATTAPENVENRQ